MTVGAQFVACPELQAAERTHFDRSLDHIFRAVAPQIEGFVGAVGRSFGRYVGLDSRAPPVAETDAAVPAFEVVCSVITSIESQIPVFRLK